MNATETRPDVMEHVEREAAPTPAVPPKRTFEDGTTDQDVPERPTLPSRRAPIIGALPRKGWLAAVSFMVYLALLGFLFYAGAAQQSALDQQLHAQYYPSQATYYGDTSSYDPQTAAALAVGTPPGANAPGIGSTSVPNVPTPGDS